MELLSASRTVARQIARDDAHWRSYALPVLLAFFAANAQRYWGTLSGNAFMAAALLALLAWLTLLRGSARIEDQIGNVVDMVLIIPVIAMIFGLFSGLTSDASAIRETLTELLPVYLAWTAFCLSSRPFRRNVVIALAIGITHGAVSASAQFQTEHLFLSLFLSLLVIKIASINGSSPALRDQTSTAALLRDPLTDLPSPAFFEAELAHMSVVAERHVVPVTVLICQYSVAEEAPSLAESPPASIRATAWAIAACVRISDTVCHWDQGRFAVLLPGTTRQEAAAVVEKIAKKLGENGTARTQLAFGVAQRNGGEDPMMTFLAAERELATAQMRSL